MTLEERPLWAAYVLSLREVIGLNQTDFASVALGSSALQGKVSRWEKGGSPPNRAAHVAEFARRLGRNPLEAFVAAGMLKEDEAGRGLRETEREVLHLVARRNEHGVDIHALSNLVVLTRAQHAAIDRALGHGLRQPRSSEEAPNLALVADEGDIEPAEFEEG